ncbi:MAG: tRNA (adenosine(37)-N6)-dimethylallyltransferase MiaA [Gammaproteobacteria bacterium]|nr:tRNA (adenosine(37)-N6)-dimethylallyltransferase MiaA [Gammaproteobacteria bacterium]|tara:strand:+ start:1440 stop:2339 length:900 start_codon:yes stop_codon:yes gene_type:complete
MPATRLLVVAGPTASGKTTLGVKLAEYLGGEIISADSRQVYRGMDIGSGKDLDEYGDIPYHLIDILDPGDEFNVYEFQRRFCDAFALISSNAKLPLLVGGTGLYLASVLDAYDLVEAPVDHVLRESLETMTLNALTERLKELDPALHNTTDLLDPQRTIRAIEIVESKNQVNRFSVTLPEFEPVIFAIDWDRSALRKRITKRLKDRLENGLIEEVEQLHIQGVSWETLHNYGLEYRFVASYLNKELNKNDMYQKLNSAIHAFAKRQQKWFRRMERNGTVIHWLDGEMDTFPQALEIIQE